MVHNMFDFDSGALWKDENFDISIGRSTNGKVPDLTFFGGALMEVAAFDGRTLTEEVSMVKELNHDYQQDTPIGFHLHWMPTTTNSGTVSWNLDYIIKHPATSITVSGTLTVLDTSSRIAWKIQTADFPDIDLGVNALIGAQIHFRFYRSPTLDTYPDDATLATMGYHYQTNSRGSSERIMK